MNTADASSCGSFRGSPGTLSPPNSPNSSSTFQPSTQQSSSSPTNQSLATKVSSHIFKGEDGNYYQISITLGQERVSAPEPLWKAHIDQLVRINLTADFLKPGCNLSLTLGQNGDICNGQSVVAYDNDEHFKKTRNAIIDSHLKDKPVTPPQQIPPAVSTGTFTSVPSSNPSTPLPSPSSTPLNSPRQRPTPLSILDDIASEDNRMDSKHATPSPANSNRLSTVSLGKLPPKTTAPKPRGCFSRLRFWPFS